MPFTPITFFVYPQDYNNYSKSENFTDFSNRWFKVDDLYNCESRSNVVCLL